ncbi:MAG: NfeD family protein [Clostridiales bacterium]|jgi:membrane protein implicated in regulation of membrane protease activity|nr:NfeD family protein [Clostridiales bacterium]
MFQGEIFWLVAVVLFCVIEGLTFSLVCIWFAGGAVAALLLSVFGLGPVYQYSAFVAVSGALLCFTRPVVKRFFAAKKTSTNADRVIGQTAVVIRKVDPVIGVGQVKVLGQIWSCKPEDGASVFEEGALVDVTGISGVKALVRAHGGVGVGMGMGADANAYGARR